MDKRGEDQDREAGKTETAKVDSRMSRRYPVALVLFGVLGVLVWFTLGDATVMAFHRPVEMRLIALLVIGSFVLRTVLARHAEKIRRGE
jgi:hypothetical protein